jgi:hypothetical protein
LGRERCLRWLLRCAWFLLCVLCTFFPLRERAFAGYRARARTKIVRRFKRKISAI